MSRIGLPCRGAQVDRSAVLLNATPDIARHPLRHRRCTVGGLKFAMDQCLLVAEAYADQAISAVRFDSGLLGVNDF